MDQDVYRIEEESQPRQQVPRPRRNRAGTFALTFVALLLGIAAGLVWMYQTGALQSDAGPIVADSTPAAPTPATAVEEPANSDLAAFEFPDQDAAVNPEISDAGAPDAAQPADVLSANPASQELFANTGQPGSAATSAARIQAALAAREPTPTPTPLPLIERLDAVIALGGAELWDADTGLAAGRIAQGALFVAESRSPDNAWLLGTTADGTRGWVAAEQVIAFDIRRLQTSTVAFAPVTPTPFVAQVLIPTPTPAAAAAGSTGAAPAPGSDNLPAPSVQSDSSVPIARISLADARLNVRAGPGAHHAIVTKAHPDEVFTIIGRSADGTWVQLAIPELDPAYGWAAAGYVEIWGDVNNAPVSSQVSGAPPYVEGSEADRVRRQREARGHTVPAPGPITVPTHVQPTLPAHLPASAPQPGVLPNQILVDHGLAAPPPPPQPASFTAAPVTGLQGKLAIQTSWGGDIYIYEFATGQLRLLTGGFDPALSPDGTQVAFTRAGGEHGLYLINVDGSNERLIFNDRELFRSPKWSPDGNWIVFERADEFTDCRNVGRRCPRDQQPREGYPAGIMRQPMLSRVDVNGQNYRDLGVLQSARSPDWSHAGIVYSSAAGVQVTHDQPDAVTAEVYFQIQKQYELDPSLQPNGHWVVFQRREASHWEIYRVNLDGSGLTALTRPAFTLVRQLPANVAPAWSPDGQHIVFLSNRLPNHEAGEWALWVMDAGGGNQRRLPIDLPFTYTYVGEQMVSWGR